jgi:hypothetical protein
MSGRGRSRRGFRVRIGRGFLRKFGSSLGDALGHGDAGSSL